VLIDGVDHTRSDPRDRNVGMVFQSYALYPTMSVAANLGFGLRARGMRAAEVRSRVQQAAQLLQLEPLLKRRPAELSGGQRQRVAIGRALVREARLLLLDEPLSNLDAALRATLRRELKLLHQRLGATMIHVTHDQVEAMTLATRLAVMRGGRIEQLGTPAEVYGRPASREVAAFIGSPGMNFIEGRFGTRGGALQFLAAGLELDLPAAVLDGSRPQDGEPVVLGVRPEHLRLGLPHAAVAHARARVSLVEPLGSHEIVWLDFKGRTLAALKHEARSCVIGEELDWHIDPVALSLFDPASGKRL